MITGQLHLLTTDEIAEELHVHLQTIYRLIKRGEIPYVKIGGSYRFDLESLKRWIEAGTIATREARYISPSARGNWPRKARGT
jgi:excisionase family DNA binding protein